MAAGSTYTPISTQTLASSTAVVTFSSIPSTYTDLILVVSKTMSGVAGSTTLLTFNSDTATNYSTTRFYGNGTVTGSDRVNSQTYFYGTEFNDSLVQSISTFQVMNYSNTTTYKSVLTRTNTPSTGLAMNVSIWRSTAAINTIALTRGGSNLFLTGSIFTLYGIKAA